MRQEVEKRFWSLNLVCGVCLAVCLVYVGLVVWDIVKDIRSGQRRLAEVARLDESERTALYQGCVELAKRKSGPVEFRNWPLPVVALKPESIQVRDDGVVVVLNAKRFGYAALHLSRSNEADAWMLYLINFDGSGSAQRPLP